MTHTQKRTMHRHRLPAAVLAAAGLLAALTGTALAVRLVQSQNSIRFIGSTDEIDPPEQTGSGPSAVAVGTGFDRDWEYTSAAEDFEGWWDSYGNPIVETRSGTSEEGWTEVLSYEADGAVCSKYRAETLSGFHTLWDGAAPDLSWLETHYTAVPNTQRFYTRTVEGEVWTRSASGEFRGEGETLFSLDYTWYTRSFGDSYTLTGGYDYTELYQTPDGVTIAISMATSNAGTELFWAEFSSGHVSFSMTGKWLALDDLHAILDSLNLSALCETRPE